MRIQCPAMIDRCGLDACAGGLVSVTIHGSQEASGTSGMKAAHNGVVNFGVLDGWWIEGWIEGVTGWSIGPEPGEKVSYEEARNRELEDFYGKLEHIIIPMFYHRRDEWIRMMNNSIGMVASFFNSHRMMRMYVTETYL